MPMWVALEKFPLASIDNCLPNTSSRMSEGETKKMEDSFWVFDSRLENFLEAARGNFFKGLHGK